LSGPKRKKKVWAPTDSGDETDAPEFSILAGEKSLSRSGQVYDHCYDKGDDIDEFFMQ
jgi:hypothetical protein